jgi:PAS domain S-box-containing protein
MGSLDIGDRRRLIPRVSGLIVALVGVIVLVGWATGNAVLTDLATGLASMKANTAASLTLLGLALVMLSLGGGWRIVARLIALPVVLVGLATIAEYALNQDIGLDQLLVRDPLSATNPGRMSLATALGVLAVAGSVATLELPRLRSSVSYGLALFALLISGVALIGYLYGVQELYRLGPFATVALHTAGALAVLAVGLVFAQPESSALGRALGQTPGGLLIRRLLPATTVFPIVLGFVILEGARLGYYSTEFGIALLVIAIIVLLRAFVFRTAVTVDGIDQERSAATEEAIRAQQRQRMVTDTIADAVISIDATSTIEFANPAAERIFGYTAAELAGQPLTKLMPERFRNRHLAALRRYVDSGNRTIAWDGTELVGLRRDGREFPIDVAFAEDLLGEHRTFTGTIRDISARKSLEEQLVQAQRLESIGRLAGGIAHDFNNILTAILGYAGLLSEELPANDPNRDKVVGIEQAARRATTLVRQLLAFGRRQVLHPEVLDVNEVIRAVTPMLERVIGEDIRFATRLTGKVHPIEADRGQLEQVLVNLVVNARDAMPRGGQLTIETENVELDEAHAQQHPEVMPGRHVMLAVSDTGHGMDAATQARIFEPFFTTKEVGRGTGLGLATVYGIVRQSGGHIWVYSEPDKGTSFRLYFPFVAAETERASTTPPAVLPEERNGRETVLVAEDEASLRRLIETVLHRRGYTVVSAANAASALDALKRQPVDLLVTDIVMPGRSGVELAAAVRAVAPGLRIVFISGYTAGAIEHHGSIDEEDVLLQKPFTPDGLAQAVRSALDRPA